MRGLVRTTVSEMKQQHFENGHKKMDIHNQSGTACGRAREDLSLSCASKSLKNLAESNPVPLSYP